MIKILVLNDMHVGSKYGVCPKDKIDNAFQKWVYQKFDNIICSYSNNIEYLVLLGDIVDGYALRDSTSLWTSDVNTQVNAAVDLLRPLCTKQTKIIGASGSGYHTGKGGGYDGDRLVTEQLNGKHNRMAQDIETPHGIIRFYHQSRNIRTELTRIVTRNATMDGPKVKMLIGGHLHRYEVYEKHQIKIVHTPCWEFPTDFMGVVSEPINIGCILITINETGIFLNEHIFGIPRKVEKNMLGYEEVNDKQIKKKKKEINKEIARLSKTKPKEVKKIFEIRENIFLPQIPKFLFKEREIIVEKIKIPKIKKNS